MSSSNHGAPPQPPSTTNSKPFPSTTYYPEEAWLSLSIFLFAIGLFKWGSVLHSKLVRQRRPLKAIDEESTHSSARPVTGWSLARLPLAAVNVFRVVAFRWTLEFGTYDLKVAEVLLTLAYIAFLLAWTFEGNGTLQSVSRWSGRAGIVAASQFPLVTALGTKNNIVSLVTGIGYEKLNYMHRVTARSCFGLLLIHAGSKIYLVLPRITQFLGFPWLRWGIVAVVAFLILFIVSLRGIRTRAYELFFYAHFMAVFIILLGAYFHTSASVINASYWIWPSFMFWAIDRFIRVTRTVIFNHLYCGFGRRAKLQDATTELLSDDFVRVRVRRPPHFQWSPGQTAYLIMPTVSKFPLEAHPFSISSVDSVLFPPFTRDPVRNGEIAEIAEVAQWKELVFIINVRGGFTKRLKDVAARNQTVKLFIDGPYGCAPDPGAYDTCIFVAGGSGVTYSLPVFLNVIEAVRNGASRCRRLVFIWAVRDASHVQWISDALYRANALAPSWLTVSIRIFVTGGGIPLSPVDPLKMSEKDGSYEWLVPPCVRMENGRPDVKSILRGEVNTATGRMSVTVCGSQSLTRSVRGALRFPVSGLSSILSGGPSVTLNVESFGYA